MNNGKEKINVVIVSEDGNGYRADEVEISVTPEMKMNELAKQYARGNEYEEELILAALDDYQYWIENN